MKWCNFILLPCQHEESMRKCTGRYNYLRYDYIGTVPPNELADIVLGLHSALYVILPSQFLYVMGTEEDSRSLLLVLFS